MEMEFFDKPEHISEEMKAGLARLYSDEGIRGYLIHAIQIANHNVLASLRANKPELSKEYAIRISTLEAILEKGKNVYMNMNNMKKLSTFPSKVTIDNGDSI